MSTTILEGYIEDKLVLQVRHADVYEVARLVASILNVSTDRVHSRYLQCLGLKVRPASGSEQSRKEYLAHTVQALHGAIMAYSYCSCITHVQMCIRSHSSSSSQLKLHGKTQYPRSSSYLSLCILMIKCSLLQRPYPLLRPHQALPTQRAAAASSLEEGLQEWQDRRHEVSM